MKKNGILVKTHWNPNTRRTISFAEFFRKDYIQKYFDMNVSLKAYECISLAVMYVPTLNINYERNLICLSPFWYILLIIPQLKTNIHYCYRKFLVPVLAGRQKKWFPSIIQ